MNSLIYPTKHVVVFFFLIGYLDQEATDDN